MISFSNGVFKIDTDESSYIFDITEKGHLRHIYYGSRLPAADVSALEQKCNITMGSTVDYDKETANYCLDDLLLEYSGIGKGDFRQSPAELIMPDGSFVSDFVYESHEIIKEAYKNDCGLPFAKGEAETLLVKLHEAKYPKIRLVLSYCVFEHSNIIARNTELHNEHEGEVIIRSLMSMMLDFPAGDYSMLTLDGSWAKEAHPHEQEIGYGIKINSSVSGDSSNRHNSAFMIKRSCGDEFSREAFGFNLIYSGNHFSAAEKAPHDTVRVISGINPHCFLWKLKNGESFVTPQAVMTFSAKGAAGVTENMHGFVNENIIPENFRDKERPIVVNNWEATFFNFNRRKLLALARKAKRLGIEMFVLDDGWFGKRNSDFAGLGDWFCNEKKLPGGISSLSGKIHKMGMKFGLWFEPECVNEDSDLFRAHPDWAITVPGRKPSFGRNQLVLDITREEVRDYIVSAVDKVLSSAEIEYVKWDFNRHISDMYSPSLKNQGEFFHRYILGLYEILRRIFLEKHPEILLESCSSGGNRFDLGMLCFSPQIWTSDDTDAMERIEIQGGIYNFYPLSCVSCHVSMVPNQQTLRSAALSTRFNAAAFGVLGYELDFGELTPEERKQIKKQIAFYKEHRHTFQYGKLSRCSPRKDRLSWQISEGGKTLAAIFNTAYSAIPPKDSLRILSAENGKRYRMVSVEQSLKISRFGSLIKHVSPVNLNSEGFILRTVNKYFSMKDGKEEYEASGEAFQSGIPLAMQYSGTGYDPSLRILGDFGSSLYLINEIDEKERKEKQNG